jgi:hypothetical protein
MKENVAKARENGVVMGGESKHNENVAMKV